MKKTKKKKLKIAKIKLTQSPLWKGLWGLLPVVVMVVFGMDFFKTKSVKVEATEGILASRGGVSEHFQLSRIAARAGDMVVARSEYGLAEELSGGKVLGSSETEELVWPEEVIREQLSVWEKEARETASSKLYLRIAAWYWRLGDLERAREFYNQAAEIDPNDPLVLSLSKLLSGN